MTTNSVLSYGAAKSRASEDEDVQNPTGWFPRGTLPFDDWEAILLERETSETLVWRHQRGGSSSFQEVELPLGLFWRSVLGPAIGLTGFQRERMGSTLQEPKEGERPRFSSVSTSREGHRAGGRIVANPEVSPQNPLPPPTPSYCLPPRLFLPSLSTPPYPEKKESPVHRTTLRRTGFLHLGAQNAERTAPKNNVNQPDNTEGVDPSGCC